jgi:hypothetical protein
MSESEFDQMSSTGRVVEGAGGRTYVISPPDPAAYQSAARGSIYAEFNVPSDVLHPASQPNYWQIPGPNITTGRFWAPAIGIATSHMHRMGVFEMNLIESLIMWACSLEGWLRLRDVTVTSGNSPDGILRRSAWVNIQHGDQEAELILWESGEAEFGSSNPRSGTIQEHYKLDSVNDLGPVLSRLLMAID